MSPEDVLRHDAKKLSQALLEVLDQGRPAQGELRPGEATDDLVGARF